MKDNRLVILLFIVCLTAASAFVALAVWRTPTVFEALFFQLVILATSILGSHILGKKSAIETARDRINLHARSAFRRVTSLYGSLYSLSDRIEELKGKEGEDRLDLIQALVGEQIRTGQDAMEDWRDIVPEEVKQIEKRSAQR